MFKRDDVLEGLGGHTEGDWEVFGHPVESPGIRSLRISVVVSGEVGEEGLGVQGATQEER